MKIRMVKVGIVDGAEYSAGEDVECRDDIAHRLIQRGYAEEANKPKRKAAKAAKAED